MLNTDPASMLQEIRSAEDLRKRFLTNTTSLVRRYVGNWYRSDSRGKPRPENAIFTFVATLLPNLIFDNPAVTVSAKRSISHKQIAQFMRMALNSWIKEVNLRSELEMLAVDMLFSYGCAKIGVESRADGGAGGHGVEGRFTVDALTPYFIRLAPGNVIIDPQADSWHSARFVGHQFQRDLADLQGDDRYDQKIVEQLTADDEATPGRSGAERAFTNAARADQVRGRVTLYELYLPETRQIGAIALHQDGKGSWIRPLAPYHGPAAGPYVFFGVYLVPDQVYPLSPIAAMAEQDQELNAHAAAAAKEAASAKSLVLVDADHPDAAAKIIQAENGSVLTVKGLNGNMIAPIAVGGTTEQRVGYLQLLLQRTDRIAGQSEATRGRATGVTATEAQLADSNADSRTEFLHLKYRDAVKDGLSRVAWYHYHDPAVVAPVSQDDPATGQPFEGLFLGGIQEGQEDTDWTQFNLDIESMSMRRVDSAQQQQQANFTVQLVTSIAPMMVQMPWINWPALLDLVGEAHNMPDFAQLVLNPMGMQLIQANMMGNGMLAQGGQMPMPGAMGGGMPQIPANPMGGMDAGAGAGAGMREPMGMGGMKPAGNRPMMGAGV